MTLERMKIVLVKLYTFLTIGIRKISEASQPIKVEFNIISEDVPGGIYG